MGLVNIFAHVYVNPDAVGIFTREERWEENICFSTVKITSVHGAVLFHTTFQADMSIPGEGAKVNEIIDKMLAALGYDRSSPMPPED